MQFKNRLPAAGKADRKLITCYNAAGAVTESFYANVTTADEASNANDSATVLSAENLNNLTVKADNIEGVIGEEHLPALSAGGGIAISGNKISLRITPYMRPRVRTRSK